MSKQDVREKLELDVKIVSIDFNVCVTMSASNNAPFDFVTSVNEFGLISLTPINLDTSFTDVTIVDELHGTTINTENETTQKTFFFKLNTTMFKESENTAILASVDELGQAIISPEEASNMFITASVEQNNQLVTEEIDVVPRTKGSYDVIVDSDSVGGVLQCDTVEEAVHMIEILIKGYEVVTSQWSNSKIIIKYYRVQSELLKEIDARLDLIVRVLQQDIKIIEGTEEPHSSWIHIDELDSDNCKYYYDEEQDVIVSYGAVD